MAINFPASPSVNDTYTVNSVVYTWDGTKWNASTGFVSYSYADKIQEGDSTAEVIDNGGDAYFAVTNNAVEKFRVNADGQLSTPYAGNASSPALYVGGDINSGLYSPGVDQLALATNGTGRLFVDANGNVGVGESSPTWKLDVSNASTTLARFTKSTAGDAFVRISSHTGGIVGLQLGDDGDIDKQQIRADNTNNALIFNTANSERLRITSDGKVGLGTSSPDALLHLSSGTGAATPTPTELRIATTANASNWSTTDPWGRISFYSADASDSGPKVAAAIDVTASSSTGGISGFDFKLAQQTSGTLTSRLYISPEGNVGVGTTSPLGQTHIQSSSTGLSAVNAAGDELVIEGGGNSGMTILAGNTSQSSIYFADSDNAQPGALNYSHNDNSLAFRVNANERARIDSSGRLLVGTSSTITVSAFDYKIQTAGNSTEDASIGLNAFSTNTAIEGRLNFTKSATGTIGNNALVSDGEALGSIRFYGSQTAGYTQAAKIECFVDGEPETSGDTSDMPGRLVFSTTADGVSAPTERMRIDSGGSILFGAVDVPSVSTAGAGFEPLSNGRMAFKSSTSTTSSSTLVAFYNPNGLVGSIATSGSATAYNTSSDYRLKENVTPVTDGITRLQQLKPSRFNFIADPDATVDGFLAHEVQNVVPEAITGEKDAVDENGDPEYQGIDQSKMVPLVVAALQECIKKVEALEAEVASLKAGA